MKRYVTGPSRAGTWLGLRKGYLMLLGTRVMQRALENPALQRSGVTGTHHIVSQSFSVPSGRER